MCYNAQMLTSLALGNGGTLAPTVFFITSMAIFSFFSVQRWGKAVILFLDGSNMCPLWPAHSES